MKNKILLAIADGLGDRPCAVFSGKTPLEHASTPHLDRIAASGCTGIMDLHKAGVPVGTDLGHLILFGYSLEDYPGRGPIEAFGEGVELMAGDVALRCNFASLDDELCVVDRRAGRIREGTAELAAALDGMMIDGIRVLFKEATEHRAVMVLRGPGLSAAISDTDPKKEGVRVKNSVGTDGTPEAAFTASVLNRAIAEAHRILRDHPINARRSAQGLAPASGILTRGAGRMPNIEKIALKLGFSACCIASERTVLGVARIAGFEPRTDAAFTGNIDTDIAKKARFAVDALRSFDLVVLHYKATDLMGHDDDPRGKAAAIERYDAMVGMVLEGIEREIPDNVIVALAADHSTPCERREHSGDPVPVAICAANFRLDDVTRYDEISCSRGGLGRISGSDFNSILLDYLEATVKQGN